jgi:hypothetical protein
MELVINFYLTDFCNFHCEHCVHESSKWKKNHMSQERFSLVMDILTSIRDAGNQIHTIGITGGEPMCHPNFYTMLRFLKNFKETNENQLSLELHTNGSIKFQQIDNFNKIFRNVFIGHDDFHRKFRKLSELYLDELTYVSELVSLKRYNWIINGELLHPLREKGRAVNLNMKKCFTKKECTYERIDRGLVFIDFAPDHIRFCGENSHYFEAKENFVEYNNRFIKQPNLLLKKALNFVNFHNKEKCRVQCNTTFFKIRESNEY